METTTKKTATYLTTESVSILTQQVYYTTEKEMQMVEGEPQEVEVKRERQVGENHRCAYVNSESGRTMLAKNEPEDIVAEVMAVWGNTPTVKEPEFDDQYIPTPSLEDRVTTIEETLANDGSSRAVWDEIANAISEGVNEA